MTFPGFEELSEDIECRIRSMSSSKGIEYANGEDRLANFKEIAAEIGVTPEQVCYIYMAKHVRAVASYCKRQKTYSEPIEGRLLDIQVYCRLMEALIIDRKEEMENAITLGTPDVVVSEPLF